MRVDPEAAVRERYSTAAAAFQNELCCPVVYSPKYLEAIPEEVLERDYGCGDPSSHLHPGETVLDLGSGSGKICFIASQVVGPEGRVIGVDMNGEMLALARSAAPRVAERIGFSNVEFKAGKIQDLAFDPAAAAEYLAARPVRTAEDALAFEAFLAEQRRSRPLIPDGSVDVVVSNCVLNLVRPADKSQLFRELFRVIRVGGRAVISDIVSDEDVPLQMKEDFELWSGCVSGAHREDLFLGAFQDAGFHGIRILKRDVEPWRTVEGIEFRSITVEAFKGKEGPCYEGLQAVIYKGPFSEVVDDDGHRIPRGVRYAVCEKTFRLYALEPYLEHFEFVEPRKKLRELILYDCSRNAVRHPRETKGMDYEATTEGAKCCDPDSC